MPVAYARRAWTDRGAVRVYEHTGRVHPAWRRRGLGRAPLRHQAAVLRTLAVEQAHAGEVALGSWTDEPNPAATALLVAEGYRPIRWYVEMVRPSIDPVAAASIPDGIRIATPDPADRGLLLALLAIQEEAFRDHWGHHASTDDQKAAILADPSTDPGLGRVAWDGDEMAGVVRPMIFAEENADFGRRRIWIETLSVRRPWRRRGVARAQAGESGDPALPPMGLRVRLKTSVDISRFGPQSQVVLRALQRYGMMLADNGAPWYAGGAPDARWDDDDLHRLGELTGADFEVVDTTTLPRVP